MSRTAIGNRGKRPLHGDSWQPFGAIGWRRRVTEVSDENIAGRDPVISPRRTPHGARRESRAGTMKGNSDPATATYLLPARASGGGPQPPHTGKATTDTYQGASRASTKDGLLKKNNKVLLLGEVAIGMVGQL
eukprot:gene22163-biopygen13260